ncbi:dual specificity protein kinase YAK1 [Verticillium alfalfae VaMs.102]|uniref:Dual specificity protein kinase YAK1 n=1 Tax=Verticillium alfalfae (strain VaMs.102 / ATCC MYA-4576 / FGSC 10136) TaxID=526221 RepID=C9SR94_VERA1|nr:dual specificity protein kinase YAK1 [Verticillium alfalfae VaMs.102]EEY20896.1 dual specificity protein kinase YAK1 [Verticillium alfalfae VaMs.102]
MDSQWQQSYADSGASSRRYNNGAAQIPRDYAGQVPPQGHSHTHSQGHIQGQNQPPAGFKYEQYQQSPGAAPLCCFAHGLASGRTTSLTYLAAVLPTCTRPRNLRPPRRGTPPWRPYRPRLPTRPSPPVQGQFVSPPDQRQSPTRQQSDYNPQSPYYAGRQQAPQLPPITPYTSTHDGYPSSAVANLDGAFAAADPKSPRRPVAALNKSVVPEFKPVRALTDLRPKVSAQPPFRRANPEGGFHQCKNQYVTESICGITASTANVRPCSLCKALTVHLPATYRICNPNFKYESSRNPRRVLTKPSKGVKNDGFDNEDSDYILYVNDILGSEEAGHNSTPNWIRMMITTSCDSKDTFIHRQHLCLVFELLSVNLYELIKQNQFRGLSTTLVRVFAQQLLNGLALLNKARLIHCDLKPENILLKNLESPIIKIIDFGSACDERQTVYTYIQSRFYRSPEVLLGLPYSSAIDMWSLGCIVVELFLGLPLFPGSSEYNQVSRIVDMLGNPSNWMVEMGKQAGEFFEKRQDEFGRRTYQLKPMEQYAREHSTKEQPSKKYFQANTLPDIIKTYPMPRKNMKQNEIDREMNNRIAFIDFVRGLLNINPLERWSPQQAKLHPFITQQKFTGPFVPPMNLKSSSLNRSPAPGTQQQQQAEALSKQRAQAAQAQAHSAAQGAYASMNAQYQQAGHAPATQSMYGSNVMYSPGGNHAPQPPAYGPQPGGYGQQQVVLSQAPQQMPAAPYGQQPNINQGGLYPQNNMRPGRQRASTMDQQQSGIPAAIQRVASHLDPSQPIRLQPSPAYYPPPGEVRRTRAGTCRNSRPEPGQKLTKSRASMWRKGRRREHGPDKLAPGTYVLLTATTTTRPRPDRNHVWRCWQQKLEIKRMDTMNDDETDGRAGGRTGGRNIAASYNVDGGHWRLSSLPRRYRQRGDCGRVGRGMTLSKGSLNRLCTLDPIQAD